MTGEEMERTIEFILKQQAQFNADIEILKEMQAETSREVKATSATVTELSNLVANGFIRIDTQADADRKETREAIANLITDWHSLFPLFPLLPLP